MTLIRSLKPFIAPIFYLHKEAQRTSKTRGRSRKQKLELITHGKGEKRKMESGEVSFHIYYMR